MFVGSWQWLFCSRNLIEIRFQLMVLMISETMILPCFYYTQVDNWFLLWTWIWLALIHTRILYLYIEFWYILKKLIPICNSNKRFCTWETPMKDIVPGLLQWKVLYLDYSNERFCTLTTPMKGFVPGLLQWKVLYLGYSNVKLPDACEGIMHHLKQI